MEIYISDKFQIEAFFVKQWRKKFKNTVILPSVGVIWDTQCGKGFTGSDGCPVHGWNDLVFYFDWFNFSSGVTFYFRTNEIE